MNCWVVGASAVALGPGPAKRTATVTPGGRDPRVIPRRTGCKHHDENPEATGGMALALNSSTLDSLRVAAHPVPRWVGGGISDEGGGPGGSVALRLGRARVQCMEAIPSFRNAPHQHDAVQIRQRSSLADPYRSANTEEDDKEMQAALDAINAMNAHTPSPPALSKEFCHQTENNEYDGRVIKWGADHFTVGLPPCLGGPSIAGLRTGRHSCGTCLANAVPLCAAC